MVFAGEVDSRTTSDPRVADLEARVAKRTTRRAQGALVTDLAQLRASVRSQKLGEVAAGSTVSTASSGW